MKFTLYCLLLWLCSALLSVATSGEDGKALYFDGKRSNGAILRARVAGGAVLQGELAACVRCHRPSGYGVNESDARTADITAATLFNPLKPRRDYLMRSLYQERHGVLAQMSARTPRSRPAYQNASDILRALREGVDTAGEKLSAVMPRYDIDIEDATALKAFLQTLGNEPSPGVDSETIHFATVVSEVDSERKNTMLTVMRAFIELHNREVAREKARADYSPLYKSELVHARRYWRLHVWTLPEQRQNWPTLLEKLYSEQPVFALLGGHVNGVWKPIHEFCEGARLPCLFPQTNWPVTTAGQYTLYLSQGIPGETQQIADRLDEIDVRNILQITGSDRNAAAAAVLLEKLAQERGFPIKTVSLTEYLNNKEQNQSQIDSAVLWFNASDFSRLSDSGVADKLPDSSFAAGSLLVNGNRSLPEGLPPNLNLTWQYALPGQEPPRLYRLRGWLAARQIHTTEETTALNTYLALDAVRHALVHAVDRYSRDYLIETIEHEIENQLNPGIYPRLSLGPGQRFAAKGARLRVRGRP